MNNHRLKATAALLAFALSGVVHADDKATAKPAEATIDLGDVIPLVPDTYRHVLVQKLSLAEDNQPTWLAAIQNSKPEHREALAYLLVHMPEADLKSLKGDFINKNVDLAYQAREASPWAKAIPQELFFSDVLPYANTDERRDDWRQDFFDKFMPVVKDCKTSGEAAQALNKAVFPAMKVKYHATKRERPIQSPYESAKIGYASCTGLAIMLTDACRAVGVPARVVGTPQWTDNTGNHTWTEVWDNQWHFVGAAEPGKLDKTWFVGNAAKADDSKPEYRIYAMSYQQTPTPWFMTLKESTTGPWAIDVTSFYVGRQTLTVTGAKGNVLVRHQGNIVGYAPADAATFSLGAGQKYDVEVIDHAGKPVSSQRVELKKDAPATVELK